MNGVDLNAILSAYVCYVRRPINNLAPSARCYSAEIASLRVRPVLRAGSLEPGEPLLATVHGVRCCGGTRPLAERHYRFLRERIDR